MANESPTKPSNLSPTLSRTDDELKALFYCLKTVGDVADLLEIPTHQLAYLLWRKPQDKRYQTWEVRKRNGGVRKIDAPHNSYKILQKKLSRVLMLVAQRRSAAHAFINGRSIVTNASKHLRCRWILNVDLKDFFPSIHFGRVRGMFMAKPYKIGQRAATALAQLCCHEKQLPQGAPTSPIISNMICARLDGELRRLAEKHKCVYTRYVDDVTFSTTQARFPRALATVDDEGEPPVLGKSLLRIINNNGFTINPDKIRLQSRRMRQEVTGLIVNRRPNVRKQFTSQIRAMLHAWERHGYDAAQTEYLAKYDNKHRSKKPPDRFYEQVIRGKLAFLKQVRGEDNHRYLELRRRLEILTGEITIEPMDGMMKKFDVFICHASEDKKKVVEPLAKALNKAGVSVWLDAGQIALGDSLVEKISEGLANSRFVILVLSMSFMAKDKNWPGREMAAALSKEIVSGVTCVLPLMAANSHERQQILAKYPLLADKRHDTWARKDMGRIVQAVKSKITQLS